MKVTQYLLLALLLSLVSATSALALPVNKVLTVQLSAVSATGQLTTVRSISVTTDATGKVSFDFSGVPTSDTAPFLMVRVIDGTTVLRQSIVAAPAPNGSVNVGVSEVTTSQATAMLKAFADSRSVNPTLAAMIMTMVRSGAISDTDLRNISPLARAAANAFETFLSNNGAAGQLAVFRANLLPPMRDLAATYKESVDTATLANDVNTTNPAQDLQNKAKSNLLEAAKRGDAIAQFLGALVNAGADAGISPALVQAAFSEAGKAVEATASPVSSDVVSAMLAIFRTGAQHCQLRAEMRRYTVALPFLNMTSAAAQQTFKNMTTVAVQQTFNNMTTIGGQRLFKNMTSAVKQQQFNTAVQQFNAAAATLGVALVTAQENFELLFADPGFFPTLQDITFARDNLNMTLQSLLTNFIADTIASPGDIVTMQTTMAAGMKKVGGIMSNMSTATLQRAGIGSMFTSSSASSQNWTMMMVAGANFVTPPIQMTYSSAITNLASKFPSQPPLNFSLFSNPYKSLLRLQYDLMLLKLNNQLALAAQPVTQARLAQIKEDDLALRNTMLQNVTISGIGTSADLANALTIVLAQPELL